MLNYINEMSRDDMAANFHDTYLPFEKDGRVYAMRCMEFGSSYIAGDVPSLGKYLQIETDKFDLSMPDLGMVAFRGSIFYVARQAARQWRRGLRTSNLRVYELRPNGKVKQVPGNLSQICVAFLENNNAHESILSRDYARVGKYLFFRNIPVGTIKNNVITLGIELLHRPEFEGLSYAD